MAPESGLDPLIGAVADGEDVDWRRAEESTDQLDDRRAIADLRLLSEIAGVHRTLARETDAAATPLGKQWGGLEIVRTLGAGAFGEVYLARDRRLDRLVALKLLRREIAPHSELAVQVLDEARTLAKVRHPNVVTVYGAAIHEGRPGFWMEYVEGETLEDRLATEGPLGAGEAMTVGREVCRALAAVHRAGLIHRDVKARNVVRERGGRLVLMDFGAGIAAARALDPFQPRFGTPIYLPPETLAGAPAGVPGDIYAVGVLLHHLTTGRFPYEGRSFTELRQAHAEGRYNSLNDLRPDLPSEFVHVVERALGPPDARYRTAGEMAAALQAEEDGRRPWGAPLKFAVATFSAAILVAIALADRLPSGSTHPSTASQAVAILPFDNLTADPAMSNIALGISRETQRQLSASGVTLRGGREPGGAAGITEASMLAIELKADVILTATLQAVERDRFTLSARLLDGTTAARLWDRKYDLGRSEVPGIGRHLALDVAHVLGLTPELRTDTTGGPGFPAFEAYNRGRTDAQRRTPESLDRSIQAYEEAIHLAPGYAEAWAGLADSYIALGVPTFGTSTPGEARQRARTAATRALELDPDLAEAHTSLAFIEFFHDWNWNEAETRFRRAIELDPQYENAHWWYADYLTAMGREAEALSEIDWALTLDPSSLIFRRDVAWHYFHHQRYDDAIVQLRDVLATAPDFTPARTLLGRVLVESGQVGAGLEELRTIAPNLPRPTALLFVAYAEAASGETGPAEEHLRQALALAPDEYVSPYYVALVNARLGRADEAVSWLERAFEAREPTMVNVNVDPRFGDLRDRPGFRSLVTRMKFPSTITR